MILEPTQINPVFCSVMKAGIKHDQVFEELSVVLRSSHLVSALLCQLQVLTPNPPPMSMLSLANR